MVRGVVKLKGFVIRDGDRMGLRMEATLQPEQFHSVKASAWFERTLATGDDPGAEMLGLVDFVGLFLTKGVNKAFLRVGYDAPIEE